MTILGVSGGEEGFVQYDKTSLFAYPNLDSPTLLFWCTGKVLPTTFLITQAWAQQGYFLFVSDPTQNLGKFQTIVDAMNNVGAPDTESSGFAWLDVGNNTSLQVIEVTPSGGNAGTVVQDVWLGVASEDGLPQLLLKQDMPVAFEADGQTFTFTYPADIPNADPPPQSATYPIVLTLTGSMAGQFQFTGFAPNFSYLYQYQVQLDPLDPGNCQQTVGNVAIQLVPTGEPFPAYTVQAWSS